MPQYMIQFAYTADAWSAMTKNPVDRSEAIRGLAQKLGGKFTGLYYTMGEWDGVVLFEAPDDATAIATSMAAIAPGHLRSTKTTRLYTPAEMMQSMKKAQGANYQAPK